MSEPLDRASCIEHGGRRDKDGYGRISNFEGKKNVGAHRIAYCKRHGLTLASISGKVVRHGCDNPACVNPDHLELGSHVDNVRDRTERGRTARGKSHPSSKLTVDAVLFIRSRYQRRHPEFGSAPLARRFGVAKSAVVQVLSGRIWAHVEAGAC